MNAETIPDTLPAPAAESGGALAEASPEAALWARLSMKQRATVEAKTVLVRTVIALIDTGLSDSRAIDLLLARIESGRVAPAIAAACARLGHDGTVLSRATLYRYLKAWRKSGLLGLAPKHKGRVAAVYGWEARALHFHGLPSKPAVAAVARWLRQEGHATATTDRVRRYLDSLSAAEGGPNSRSRLGPRLYRDSQRPHHLRSTDNLAPGDLYVGDGHTLDVYLQHPSGNKVWRAELTLWLDVASRYPVGWWISEAESAHSTLFALSHAVITHGHVPAMLHMDNGSGYANQMLSDAATGFYARLGCAVMHSLPYNAKGKGHIERFFGTLERDLNKRLASYCGQDMAPEALQALLKGHKAGTVKLPTLAQYIEIFRQWLGQYAREPHAGLDGRTPAEVWAGLQPHPIEPATAAVFWPCTERLVRRSAIVLDGRTYTDPELPHHNDRRVRVEYNLHDDGYVRVLDLDGHWLCDAQLVHKRDYLPTSRIEEAKARRLDKQTKRLEQHIAEQQARAGRLLGHDTTLDALDALGADASVALKETGPEETPGPVIVVDELPVRPAATELALDLDLYTVPDPFELALDLSGDSPARR